MALIPKGKWIVELDGRSHIVKAERTSGDFVKAYLGDKLLCNKWLPFSNLTFRFSTDSHEFLLEELGIINRRFALTVDGEEYKVLDEIVTLHGAMKRGLRHPAVQIIREEDVQETVEVVGVEEFPLDNAAGTDVLSVEHEISKTVSNELSITESASLDGGLDLGLLAALKIQVSVNLTKQLGQNIGETVTRRQVLHFTVQPQRRVTYSVIWKRRVRVGTCSIMVNDKPSRVSYRVNYDLSYEVKSR